MPAVQIIIGQVDISCTRVDRHIANTEYSFPGNKTTYSTLAIHLHLHTQIKSHSDLQAESVSNKRLSVIVYWSYIGNHDRYAIIKGAVLCSTITSYNVTPIIFLYTLRSVGWTNTQSFFIQSVNRTTASYTLNKVIEWMNSLLTVLHSKVLVPWTNYCHPIAYGAGIFANPWCNRPFALRMYYIVCLDPIL